MSALQEALHAISVPLYATDVQQMLVLTIVFFLTATLFFKKQRLPMSYDFFCVLSSTLSEQGVTVSHTYNRSRRTVNYSSPAQTT